MNIHSLSNPLLSCDVLRELASGHAAVPIDARAALARTAPRGAITSTPGDQLAFAVAILALAQQPRLVGNGGSAAPAAAAAAGCARGHATQRVRSRVVMHLCFF